MKTEQIEPIKYQLIWSKPEITEVSHQSIDQLTDWPSSRVKQWNDQLSVRFFNRTVELNNRLINFLFGFSIEQSTAQLLETSVD